MSRRSAVLLTPAPVISNSSLFLALLALSLEGTCEGNCEEYTLVQKSEAHPLLFQSLARSLQKHRGWPQERSFNLSTLGFSTFAPTTSLESTLVDDPRVGFQGLYLQTLTRQPTEISPSCPPTSPLHATLTRSVSVTPLEATLTRNRGEGARC